MEEVAKMCKAKGIDYVCEKVDSLREYHLIFTKKNKHYKKIIPYEYAIEIKFEKNFIENLINEVEKEFDH